MSFPQFILYLAIFFYLLFNILNSPHDIFTIPIFLQTKVSHTMQLYHVTDFFRPYKLVNYHPPLKGRRFLFLTMNWLFTLILKHIMCIFSFSNLNNLSCGNHFLQQTSTSGLTNSQYSLNLFSAD